MRPLVGILSNRCESEEGVIQKIGEPYVCAVRDGAGAMPLLIPPSESPDIAGLLATFDGFVFSGGRSNIEPALYGAEAVPGNTLRDEARDGLTLALIRAAVQAGKPVLGICRGLQELNVALGGTLTQAVHEIPGRMDHRDPADAPIEKKYDLAHEVSIVPGGHLADLLGEKTFQVNSLHQQGIDRLADGLIIEAKASDGQTEAVSMPDAPGFVLGIQWHPEWNFAEHETAKAIFAAFGKAVKHARRDRALLAKNRAWHPSERRAKDDPKLR